MIKYPPYVDCYGKIPELFSRISNAAVPPKFTIDFLYTKLGLKSTTHRKFISFLKKINFLDDGQIPTQKYRDFRDSSKSGKVMADAVKKSYNDLFEANEYAYSLKKNEIEQKLISIFGASKEDKTMQKVNSTLWELLKISNFEDDDNIEENINEENINENSQENIFKTNQFQKTDIGLNYTINLNLPATNDVEVFNAIFKSLKENLLK